MPRRPTPRFSSALFVLGLAAALAACDFEQVIDLDVPPYEPRLVLGGFPVPADTFAVRVGRSESALAPQSFDDPPVVTDARLALFDGGGSFLDSLDYVPPGAFEPLGLYRSRRGLSPEPGRSYTLRAEAPGLPAVEATATMPEPTAFLAALEGVSQDPNGQRIAHIVVTLPDVPGAQTFALHVERSVAGDGEPEQTFVVPFRSADDLLRESFDRLDVAVDIDLEGDGERFFTQALFRDAAFAGTTREIEIEAFVFDEGGGDAPALRVVLSTLSDDYVRYQQTLALQNVTGDNPFAEPVRIHSNVSGGLGVFAGFTPARQTLDLGE